MTAVCIAIYALGVAIALRGELRARAALARMAGRLRAQELREMPHA